MHGLSRVARRSFPFGVFNWQLSSSAIAISLTMPHSVSPTGAAQPDDEMPDAPPVETSTENSGVKLADMFDDDDDDEFPASSAPDTNMKSPAAQEE